MGGGAVDSATSRCASRSSHVLEGGRACVCGGGCPHLLHSRSRMPIDPRIPAMPDGAPWGFTDHADIGLTKRKMPWVVQRVV